MFRRLERHVRKMEINRSSRLNYYTDADTFILVHLDVLPLPKPTPETRDLRVLFRERINATRNERAARFPARPSFAAATRTTTILLLLLLLLFHSEIGFGFEWCRRPLPEPSPTKSVRARRPCPNGVFHARAGAITK